MNDKLRAYRAWVKRNEMINDAKVCNANLYKDGQKPKSERNKYTVANGHGAYNIKPRTHQIIELCNSGHTIDQIHERVGGTKSSVRDCLKRHSQKITDRVGSFYDIKINGKDFDRIMRALEGYKRNTSIEEFNKTVATQSKLRQFEKQFDFEN